MSDYLPFKAKKQSFYMNFLGPVIILIPVFIAFYFCEWRVVVAFIVAILVIPFTFILITQLFESIFLNKSMDFQPVLETGALFAVAGIPIYFIIILPVYYILKTSSIPIIYGFPISVSIIILILFSLITTKAWGYKEFLVVVSCSIFHALFIIWLISKLKSVSF